MILPPDFYRRDALEVAIDLLGQTIEAGEVRLRITEVEAYRSNGDSANHCFHGPTPRNAPMWGAPGHAYIYLCYGIHSLLNLVTGEEGVGEAVLIRAAEPLAGEERIRERRGGAQGKERTTGPGRVAAALGIDHRMSGIPCFIEGGPLVLREGRRPTTILAGPRIGIDYAAPADREAPYRFADADSPYVMKKRAMSPRIAR